MGYERIELATETGTGLLSSSLLRTLHARAADYDKDNRFFHEDLSDLQSAGYLKAAIPAAFGGGGLSLPQVLGEQARLAYHAPATALAINMHLYWIGTAAYLWRRGDHSTDWILEEAAAGKIFAAGHGEPGSDLGLAGSNVVAEPTGDGGYRFHGRKVFTSLSPVWDWLGIHSQDNSDPENPKVVHAFIRRQDPGHRTIETWDAHGVRATRSDDTILEGVVAPKDCVTRVLPAGPPSDPFIDGIVASAILPIGAVYYGIAHRAFDIAVETAKARVSPALSGRTYAHHPQTQVEIAKASVELDSIWAYLDRVAREWTQGVDHGVLWATKLLGAKQHAVDGARRIVDRATKVAGAASLLRRNELERLTRDVRSGPFHPPNTDATHDLIGQIHLGVFPPAAQAAE